MLQIKPSKNTLIYLGLIAVIVLVVCGFVYCNRSSKLNILEAKISEKQQKLDDSEKIAKRLSGVEQQYVDAQATLGSLEQGVSTKAYVPTLLRQLEELGKSVNLRVVSVRPKAVAEKPIVVNTEDGKKKKSDTPKKAEPYDKLDIDIEVSGKYWDTVSFIHKITSFPKIIVVRNVQISPESKRGFEGSPMLSVRLSTTAFILKETASKTARKSENRADVGGGRI